MTPSLTRVTSERRIHAANSTASSLTAMVPTTTAPSTGVIGSLSSGATGNILSLALLGVGSADQTFTGKLWGWRQIVDPAGSLTALWRPTPLLSFTATLGTSPGISGSIVLATELFADTIVVGTSFTDAVKIISPADNSIATIEIDSKGFEKIQLDLAKGTATSVNGVYAWY